MSCTLLPKEINPLAFTISKKLEWILEAKTVEEAHPYIGRAILSLKSLYATCSVGFQTWMIRISKAILRFI